MAEIKKLEDFKDGSFSLVISCPTKYSGLEYEYIFLLMNIGERNTLTKNALLFYCLFFPLMSLGYGNLNLKIDD